MLKKLENMYKISTLSVKFDWLFPDLIAIGIYLIRKKSENFINSSKVKNRTAMIRSI